MGRVDDPHSEPHLLLERDGELEHLASLIASAEEGRGRVVLIEGEAGIGKTSLLELLAGAARRGATTVRSARGAESERELVFGVARTLFEPLLRDQVERDRLLAGPAARAAPALGITTLAPREAARTSPGEQLSAALLGLHSLTINLTERGPLVLAVDDAHWADAASLRFLAYLARRLDDLPLLLAIARRDQPAGSEPDPFADRTLAGKLRPAPLSTDAVGEMVAARTERAPEPAFVGACHGATRGNPYLVSELCAVISEHGIEPTADGVARIQRLGPETIAEYALARLGTFGSEAVDLARAAVVLGVEAGLADAAALAGLSIEKAAELADALRAAGIFGSVRPLELAHPIIREAIDRDFSGARRQLAARRAAQILRRRRADPDRICSQLLGAAPIGERWVVETLAGTADGALARGAPETAVAYLRRALEEPPPETSEPAVCASLGIAEAVTGDAGNAVEHLRAALAATGEPDVRLPLLGFLCQSLIQIGATGDAIAEARAEVERSDKGDASLGAEALLCASQLFHRSPQKQDLDARLDRLGPSLEPRSTIERELLACLAYRRLQRGDPASEVIAPAKAALSDASGGAPAPTAAATSLALQALVGADAYVEVRESTSEVLARAAATGDINDLGLGLLMRASAALRQGALEAAETDLRAALDGLVEVRHLLGGYLALARLVEALIERGRLAEATEALTAHPFAEPRPGAPTVAFILEAHGLAASAQGRHAEALEWLGQAGEAFAQWSAPGPGQSAWRSRSALTLRSLGRLEEGLELADQELALSRRFEAPRPLGIGLRTTGLLTGGEAGLARLRQSVETLEDSGASLELAKSLYELGAAMRRAKSRADAREPLRRALDLAVRCGATPLAERAEAELRATGARPRRIVLSGVESLTTSERRVAELAATGLSNPEIAQQLYVTRATVQSHLHAAYRKLEISSRSQLSATLGKDQ